MIRQAALYFPNPEDARAALLVVAGRPVAFRAVMAALRAGCRRVALPGLFRRTAVEHLIAAAPAARAATVWLDDGDLGEEPTLLIPATACVPPAALAPLLQSDAPTVLAESRDTGAPVVAADTPLARAFAGEIAAGLPLGDALPRALERSHVGATRGGAWYLRVTDGADAARAQAQLWAELGSPIDTRLDVVLHRRLSRPVSRLAVAWGVTPNQVSVLSLMIGLGAVWCFWRASPASAAAGLLLYAASVVLDHSDGEVARVTLAESRLGEWLDVLVDTVIHVLLVVAMGVTAATVAWRGSELLGILAGAGVVAGAWLAKAWPPAGSVDRVGKALDRLSNRDGFYTMLVAFIGARALTPAWLPFFMLTVVAGTHAYWLGRVLHRLAR